MTCGVAWFGSEDEFVKKNRGDCVLTSRTPRAREPLSDAFRGEEIGSRRPGTVGFFHAASLAAARSSSPCESSRGLFSFFEPLFLLRRERERERERERFRTCLSGRAELCVPKSDFFLFKKSWNQTEIRRELWRSTSSTPFRARGNFHTARRLFSLSRH